MKQDLHIAINSCSFPRIDNIFFIEISGEICCDKLYYLSPAPMGEGNGLEVGIRIWIYLNEKKFLNIIMSTQNDDCYQFNETIENNFNFTFCRQIDSKTIYLHWILTTVKVHHDLYSKFKLLQKCTYVPLTLWSAVELTFYSFWCDGFLKAKIVKMKSSSIQSG